MSEPKCERTFDELTQKEKEIIKKLKDSHLEKIRVVSEWRDDHLPCVGFKVAGVQMGIWWLDTEVVGAFYYPESPRARKVIREQIRYAIESGE